MASQNNVILDGEEIISEPSANILSPKAGGGELNSENATQFISGERQRVNNCHIHSGKENTEAEAKLDKLSNPMRQKLADPALKSIKIKVASGGKPSSIPAANMLSQKSKGEKLTSEKAIQFILGERQQMDILYAHLRKENEVLQEKLDAAQAQARSKDYLHTPSTKKKYEVPTPDQIGTPQLLQEEILKLRKENDLLKEQTKDRSLLHSIPPPIAVNNTDCVVPASNSVSSLSSSSSITPPPQAGYVSSRVQLGTSLTPAKSVDLTPDTPDMSVTNGDGSINIPDILWDGMCLYKIPFNGKGSAEPRLVFVKKSKVLDKGAREVKVIDSETKKKKQYSIHDNYHYITYPLTLAWIKPNDRMEHARELVLPTGTSIVNGFNTPAFQKFLKYQGNANDLPHPSVCFSVVPLGKRTLDLAAENVNEAEQWKKALQMLLSALYNEYKLSRRQKEVDILSPGKVQINVSKSPIQRYNQQHQMSVKQQPGSGSQSFRECEPNSQSKEKIRNQLFMAIKTNDIKAFQNILRNSHKNGVTINDMDPATTDTPLMCACRLGALAIIRICLNNGGKNDPHPDFGETALHAAVAAGQFDAASLLLEVSAESQSNVIIVNLLEQNKKQSPLHLACSDGNLDMVELLLQNGADIYSTDIFGMSPLHILGKVGHKPCLAILLDHGADSLIDSVDLFGYTVLHHAAENGHLFCVRLLLETAAAVNMHNNADCTPFDLANAAGYHQICALLQEYNGMSSREEAQQAHSKSRRTAGASTGNNVFVSNSYSNNSSSGSLVSRLEEPTARSNSASAQIMMSPAPSKPMMMRSSSAPMASPSVFSTPAELPRPYMNSSPTTSTNPNTPLPLSSAKFNSNMNSANYNPIMSPPPSGALYSTPLQTPSHMRSFSNSEPQQDFQGPVSRVPYVSNNVVQIHAPLSARNSTSVSTAANPSVHDVYCPVSARERPMPSMFAGMVMEDTEQYDHPEYAIEASGDDEDAGTVACSGTTEYNYDPVESFVYKSSDWHVYYTEEGHLYYLQLATSHSQWYDPRLHGYIDASYGDDETTHYQYGEEGLNAPSPIPSRSPPKAPSPQHSHMKRTVGGMGMVSDNVAAKKLFAGEAGSVTGSRHRSRKSKSHQKTGSTSTVAGNATTDINGDDEFDSCYEEPDSGADSCGSSNSGRSFNSESECDSGTDVGNSMDVDCYRSYSSVRANIHGKRGAGRSKGHKSKHRKPTFRSGQRVDVDFEPNTPGEDSDWDADMDTNVPVNNRVLKQGVARNHGGTSSGDGIGFSQPKNLPAITGAVCSDVGRNKGNDKNSEFSNDLSGSSNLSSPNKVFVPVDGEYGTGGNTKRKDKGVKVKNCDGATTQDEKMQSNEEKAVSSNPIAASLASHFAAKARAVGNSHVEEDKVSSTEGAGCKAPATESRFESKLSETALAKETSPVVDESKQTFPLQHYITMLENGESLRNVRKLMEENSETRETIREFLNAADTVEVKVKALPPSDTKNDAKQQQSSVENTIKVSEAAETPGASVADLKTDNVLAKYAKMASMGVPAGSVQQKMMMDNIAFADMNRLLKALGAPVIEIPSDKPEPKEDSKEKESEFVVETLDALKKDPALAKYAKMASMGIPAGSVAQKMTMDGVETTTMNRLLYTLGLLSPPKPTPTISTAAPVVMTLEEMKAKPAYLKYVKMNQMGVPAGGLRAKMKLDQLSEEEICACMVALGLEELPVVSIPNTLSTDVGSNSNVSRRPSVALQKIHWSPLANEKLQKSIWAQGSSTSNSISISNEEDVKAGADLMCDEDVEEIEKLFRATTKAPQPKVLKTNDSLKDKMKLYVIEGRRALNITIGLAQYKQLILSCSPTNTLDYNILLHAIYTLNTLNNKLKVDHLENIVPLLPTPFEAKVLFRANSSQHPAEMFLYLTLQYPHLQKRLNVFVTCENFTENCDFCINQAKGIISACNEILSNDKLTKILQRMLAIGNFMNQRGQAAGGITLDSLIKMMQTKGVDKKTTILDYVVKSLIDKNESKVLEVTYDLDVIDKVAHVSSKELLKGMETVQKNFAMLSAENQKYKDCLSDSTPMDSAENNSIYQSRLQQRVDQYDLYLSNITKYEQIMKNKIIEVVEYFGEDASVQGGGIPDINKIFSTLQIFRKAINESKIIVERREKANARNRSVSRDRENK